MSAIPKDCVPSIIGRAGFQSDIELPNVNPADSGGTSSSDREFYGEGDSWFVESNDFGREALDPANYRDLAAAEGVTAILSLVSRDSAILNRGNSSQDFRVQTLTITAVKWTLACAVTGALMPCIYVAAQAPAVPPPYGKPLTAQPLPLTEVTRNFIQDGKLDEAFANVQRKSAISKDGLAQSLIRIARAHLSLGQNAKAKICLQEISLKFCDDQYLLNAWVSLHEMFDRLGQTQSLIDAVEAKVTAASDRAPIRYYDSDVAQSKDFLKVLYVSTKQWEKARKLFEEPSSNTLCGTCNRMIESERRQGLMLALLQLKRFDEAVQVAWQGWDHQKCDPVCAYVLVRLYTESGQADVLLKMHQELQAVAKKEDDVRLSSIKDETARQRFLKSRGEFMLKQSSAITKSLALASSVDTQQHLAAATGGGWGRDMNRPVEVHVGIWKVLAESKKALPAAIARSNSIPLEGQYQSRLLLAMIDSPESRKALINQASATSLEVHNQFAMARMIVSRVSNADEVIAAVNRRLSPDQRLTNDVPSEFRPPLGEKLYGELPSPPKGSLPTTRPSKESD